MKKICILGTILATLFGITSCNSQQPEEQNGTSQEPSTGNMAFEREAADNNCMKLQASADILTLIGIRDVASTMSAELFADYNDSIVRHYIPDGEIRAGINVYYMVDYYGHNILFDAGVGEEGGGMMHSILRQYGIQTDAITDICITHLHGDHIGGLITPQGKAAFPKAVLHLSQEEYNAWMTGPLKDRNKRIQTLMQLYDGRVQLFHAGDTLLNHIVTLPAFGHTPGHTCYQIGKVIVAGDLLHVEDMQLEHPEICASYDFDKEQAIQTRQSIFNRIAGTDTALLLMHSYTPSRRWVSLCNLICD